MAANAAARALAGAATLEAALPALLAEIGGAFDWDLGNYWRRDPSSDSLRHERTWKAANIEVPRFEALSDQLTLRRGEGLPGRALDSGATVWIPDIVEDPNFPRMDTARAEGLQSGIAFPLVMDGQTVGVLEFLSRASRLPAGETAELMDVLTRELDRFAQRIAAVERMRRSEAQKSAMLDAALDCIISIDARSCVVAWNPAAERTFGYRHQEAVGRDIADLLIPERLRASHRAGLARYLSTGKEKLLDRRVEMPALRRDGSEFPVELTITEVRGESPALFTAYLRDLSEAKRAEEAERFLSRASEAFAQSIEYEATLHLTCETAVPFLGDWCVIDLMEPSGRIRRVASRHVDAARNSSLREIETRYPMGPGLRQPAARVLSSGQPMLVPVVSDEEIVSYAFDAKHAQLIRDLGLRSLLAVPMTAGGRTMGALGFGSATAGRFSARDVTIAEEFGRRAALAITNAELYRGAQEAARLREQVLAVVAHDLRNPLNAVHMSAALLAKKDADPRTRKHTDMIMRASTRMNHLISDLLDVASIQSGRLRVEPTRQSAEEIAREALEVHEPLAAEKGITIRRRLELDGVEVLCDRDRVLQVLSNLLGNALKFCAGGCRVELAAKVRGAAVELSVADNGPGIPADELPHLFDPWWSAERHAGKGTGLGLFIARGIVEGHGGRLWVESQPGSGATFYFTLPLANGASTAAALP